MLSGRLTESVTEDPGRMDGLGIRPPLRVIQENDGSFGAGSTVSLWVWKGVRIFFLLDRNREENGKGHPCGDILFVL